MVLISVKVRAKGGLGMKRDALALRSRECGGGSLSFVFPFSSSIFPPGVLYVDHLP